MPVIERISRFHDDMTAWRRDLHAHPETAFEEVRTADIIAGLLGDFGIPVHRGLGKTGIVGSLGSGDGPAVGLRADMDALFIQEANGFDHKSRAPGKMHACGHDGHTAMLLGAARYLAETRQFKGTVHFIFQPAEENEGGGRVMVEQGLFEKFPMQAVYGMHNWPGRPAGSFAVGVGPVMAAFDTFEIVIRGRGAHGAMPHQGIDPVVAAADLVGALQTIASRAVDPLESSVVTVTQIHGGDTWNTIPDTVTLRGTARSFSEDVRGTIEDHIRRRAGGIAAAHGAAAEVTYERRYPATVNHPAETEIAAQAAAEVAGPVERHPKPSMGSEDFAFMLEQKPGSYIWLGNGEDGCSLHSSCYDFNDAILVAGASYWARLAERVLG